MATSQQVDDGSGLYDDFASPGISGDAARRDIFVMSSTLADEIAAKIGDGCSSLLCAVVLRGGLLMYPGFSQRFTGADFCLLGMKRASNGMVACPYLTEIDCGHYDVGLYIDCVAATGGTLLEARRVLGARCDISRHVAALLCSSKRASETLVAAGMDVVGFRLSESLDGDVVTPDLGELDAGDLFSGASPVARALSV